MVDLQLAVLRTSVCLRMTSPEVEKKGQRSEAYIVVVFSLSNVPDSVHILSRSDVRTLLNPLWIFKKVRRHGHLRGRRTNPIHSGAGLNYYGRVYSFPDLIRYSIIGMWTSIFANKGSAGRRTDPSHLSEKTQRTQKTKDKVPSQRGRPGSVLTLHPSSPVPQPPSSVLHFLLCLKRHTLDRTKGV